MIARAQAGCGRHAPPAGRRLEPWSANAGKRLVRSPRIYVRDSGIAHALLGIGDIESLLAHPVAGPSWEGFAIENLIGAAPPGTQAGFYRTAAGAEIDLVLALTPARPWAIEVKRSLAPKPERGFHQACADLEAQRRFIVYPGEERFSAGAGVEAIGLAGMMLELRRSLPKRIGRYRKSLKLERTKGEPSCLL